jgi:hypothetical protein
MSKRKKLKLIGITVWAWTAVFLSAWALFAVFNAWLVPGGESALQTLMWHLLADAAFAALFFCLAFLAKRAFRRRRALMGELRQEGQP